MRGRQRERMMAMEKEIKIQEQNIQQQLWWEQTRMPTPPTITRRNSKTINSSKKNDKKEKIGSASTTPNPTPTVVVLHPNYFGWRRVQRR